MDIYFRYEVCLIYVYGLMFGACFICSFVRLIILKKILYSVVLFVRQKITSYMNYHFYSIIFKTKCDDILYLVF